MGADVPELPDITVYLESLERRILGHRLAGVRLCGISLLRSVDPPLADASGRQVQDLRRLGKRIVLGLEDELFLVLHLMIAGRLRWRSRGAGARGRNLLAAFDFEHGTLLLSEASRKKREGQALCLAEAGVEHAVWKLYEGETGLPLSYLLTDVGGSVTTTVNQYIDDQGQPVSGAVEIISTSR